jgi:hypothetical protein
MSNSILKATDDEVIRRLMAAGLTPAEAERIAKSTVMPISRLKQK